MLALPIAFFIAKVVGPRWRGLLVAAVLVPLWASYLVKAFSWRAIIGSPGGVLDKTFGMSPNYGEVGAGDRAGVPVAALHDRADLRRVSNDCPIHCSTRRAISAPTSDSRSAGSCCRLLLPSIVAGSMFTFSLSLGDYIAVDLVGGKTQVIGSVVFDNFSADLPFAAAFAVVPVIDHGRLHPRHPPHRRIGEPLMHFTRRVRMLFGA